MTMCKISNKFQHTGRHNQAGAALVIALILMVVATLIGLSGIRSSTLQESIAASSFDRTLAMQNAEAGLRAAEQAISDVLASPTGPEIWVDCRTANSGACAYPPDGTFNGTGPAWKDVDINFINQGDFSVDSPPQYIVQLLAGDPNPAVDNDRIFRVIARSHEPNTTSTGNNENRAIVVLTSTLTWAAPPPPP